MSKFFPILFLLICFLSTGGCARVSETAKIVWGSSTRALEEARTDAKTKTYSCTFSQCFDQVLKIATEEKYTVFIQDRVHGRVVVMGVRGNLNTTEVGIFFDELDESRVKIDVTSLSTTAKIKVAEALFTALSKELKETVS